MTLNFDFLESDSEKIEFIQSVGDLITDGQITPEKLNEVLANYWQVSRYLLTLFESVSIEYENMKMKYDCWYADKFLEAKERLNADKVKSKFASATEIEQELIVTNHDEYTSLRSELIQKEHSKSFYSRLVDSWKTNAQMIIQISQNMRTELLSLSTEKKANETITSESLMRHKKVKKTATD